MSSIKDTRRKDRNRYVGKQLTKAERAIVSLYGESYLARVHGRQALSYLTHP
jgi:hypothetical protein